MVAVLKTGPPEIDSDTPPATAKTSSRTKFLYALETVTVLSNEIPKVPVSMSEMMLA